MTIKKPVSRSLSCVLLTLVVGSNSDLHAQTGSAAANWTEVAAPADLKARGAQWIKISGRGHKFLAAVFRPAGSGPFPVVVLLPGSSGLHMGHVGLAQEISSSGFIVVVGCWQSGAGPHANPICSEAPPQAAWQANPAANAGKELVAAARALPGARAERIGIFGLSRGGHAALWAASTGASVQAVIVDAPAHRPRVTPVPPRPQDAVTGLAAPTLLLHGSADPSAPVELSREYERAARALGKPVQAVYFEGVGHQVTLPPVGGEAGSLAAARLGAQAEARRQAIAFLREHLLK
jgi:dienelactone hydrolase